MVNKAYHMALTLHMTHTKCYIMWYASNHYIMRKTKGSPREVHLDWFHTRSETSCDFAYYLPGSHSLVTHNSTYFLGYIQVKAMKSQVNLASYYSICVWQWRYNKDVNDSFSKWHLEKWISKHQIYNFQVPRFSVKIPAFCYFLCANDRYFPGLEK